MKEAILNRGIFIKDNYILKSYDRFRGVPALKPMILEAISAFGIDEETEVSENDICDKIVELNPGKTLWQLTREGAVFRALDLLEKEEKVAWRWVKAEEAVDNNTHMGRFYHKITEQTFQNLK